MTASRLARLEVGACFLAAALAACRAGAETSARPGIDVPASTAHGPRSPTYDVERYALDIELQPEHRSIRAKCRILLWPAGEALRRIDLDFDDLEVSAVRDERGRSLSFRHEQGTLGILLPVPLEPGDCVELAVDYSGKPRKGLYFAADRDGRPTQVYTHGQCEDSRGWFPCFDAPSDRAVTSIRVTMPAPWTAVAAGERIERSERDGRATELWRMDTPHPAYLTTLVAGEFAVRTGDFEGTPLLYLAEDRLAPEVEANLGRTPEILSFLSQETGRRYPFPKYSQACVADFPYAGMENISATTLTDTCLVDERARRDASQIGLVVHEAAHQWFGDLLTCRDWSHVWLNEGFATYMSALFTEADRGIDEFRVQMRDLQEGYVQADVGRNRRPIVHGVYHRPMDLFFTGHAYAGGALRLHLLRFVVGDEAFFRGVRSYVDLHAGRSVVTADLRAAMESASRTDLGWFFEDWLEASGYPEFECGWRHDEKRKLLIVSVNQVQAVGGGTPAVFRTPAEIGIRDEQGFRSVRLSIDRRRQLFEIPAALEPRFVRFDPHGWIPKRLDERKAEEEWLAIASDDDDVNGRREAVRVLARLVAKPADDGSGQRALAALLDRLAKDPSGAVRADAARGVGVSRAPAAGTALRTATREDPEARVRAAALLALRAFGEDPELASFALREYEAGFSWDVKAAAAALFLASRPRGAFEWLCEQLALDAYGDAPTSKLLALLEVSQSPRALPEALRYALDGKAGEGTRAAATKVVGVLGRGRPEARKALESLLEDPSWRVRREAIGAVAELRDPAGVDALRSRHARTALDPELRALEAAIRTLRGDD